MIVMVFGIDFVARLSGIVGTLFLRINLNVWRVWKFQTHVNFSNQNSRGARNVALELFVGTKDRCCEG
jgi:hypothetical protein